ncbi:MAG TPA: ABC transporter ATP-binding protein [Devosiaceae bacterium]|nr:ABC transporter ATP-binding protein [Devosiaceae bacterium]
MTLAGFGSSLLEGVGISLLVPLLSSLSPGSTTGQAGLLGLLYRIPFLFSPEWRLPGMAGLILGCVVLKGLLQAASDMLVSWIEGHVAKDIRTQLASQLLQVGYPFFLTTGQVRLLNILSSDSWRASDAVRSAFYIVGAVTTIFVFSLLLLLTNWQLFLLTAAGAIAIRLLQNLIGRRIDRVSEVMREVNLELAQRMVMLAFDMVKLVRLFNQQQQEITRFERASEKMRQTMTHLNSVTVWAPPLTETLYAVLFLTILIGAHASGVPLPVLIPFLLLMYRMQPYIGGISAASVNIASVAASVREVEWLMTATASAPANTETHAFSGLRQAIEFDRVGFDYAAARDTPALESVTMKIEAGQWTALTGASGAGKSTVVNMLGRLLAPTSGTIRVDEVDLETIEVASWRAHVAVAGQDLDLFEGTIAENVAFGAPHATRQEIASAAMVADIHDLIASMPKGYDTPLGERGLSLSGGQKQRVGLARALVRRPNILVLDEAMNALDVESEAAIMARLKAGFPDMTVLVISHRASTLAYCDRTIALKEARRPLPRPTSAQVVVKN